jgi:hypothetical protein
MFYCLVLHWCTVPRLHAFASYRSRCASYMYAGIKLLAFVMLITALTLFFLSYPWYYVTYNCTSYRNLLFTRTTIFINAIKRNQRDQISTTQCMQYNKELQTPTKGTHKKVYRQLVLCVCVCVYIYRP